MATHTATADPHASQVPDEHYAHEALAHHFDNLEQQREAGNLGMWTFLVQEVMFFGGLFLAYVIYRSNFPDAFAAASSHLNWRLGLLNTFVLITSSLTMALAVWSTQIGRARRTQVFWLGVTALLGLVFLVVKAFEYGDKYRDHLIPIRWASYSFKWEGPLAAGVTEQNIQMFYWIYFAMTGLHALHMIIGIAILLPIMWAAWRGRYSPEYHAPVELFGLYWHFVDIVWIFLFPLLYLLGAHYGSH
ncbi:MAG TPA: cytochrome c oxidase subunit 3 family protein [Pyrinomonadaceae bacterium]|nr:cytochrome c oxidase subunit 3 family protein [Pyrinomonadaceae bacterium]